MKKLISAALLVFAVLASQASFAEEQPELRAIEYERLIINWNPNAQRLATVLAYACKDCAPVRLEITRDTVLRAGNELLLIDYLKTRVDWAGVVQTLGNQPNTIIKIMLL